MIIIFLRYDTPGPGTYGSRKIIPAQHYIYQNLGRKIKTPKVPDNVGFTCAEQRDCLAPTQTEDKPVRIC
jgi:hypothetical protein